MNDTSKELLEHPNKTEALDNQIEWGVWGGLTERERRALLRKRPNVTSWRGLLETAKADHERQIATTA